MAPRAPAPGACALAGLVLAAPLLACTTPTVAARAAWVGGLHDEDGSRTLAVYAAGELTQSALRPLAVDPSTDQQRLLLEMAPRGDGLLVRGVDDGWVEQVGSPTAFRAGYVDLDHRRAVPLELPAERVAANVAAFTAAGDALAWGETCPPAIAVVPLAPAVALTIDPETGAAVPLRSDGKPPRACPAAATPAVASAADAPIVFRIDAAPRAGVSVAVVGATVTALRYPRDAGEAALVELADTALPGEHAPELLTAMRCPGGDPSCGVAVVDPDGLAISFAVRGGGCRLLRWTVGERPACVIADDAAPELDAGHLVAAISPEHYVLRDGTALHRYDWTTGELDTRPLVGDPEDFTIRSTPDGRAVAMIRARGPMLRVDSETMELVSVAQRDCPGAQDPVISPSGRVAAWTCTQSLGMTIDDEGQQQALETGEVVRVSPGGMERYQGVPMWALAVDDDAQLLLYSQRIYRVDEVDLGATATRARNLYVLAHDGELARVSDLEPDPEQVFGLAPGVTRRITAQPM